MILNIASDQMLNSDYIAAFRSIIKNEFPTDGPTELELIDRPDQATGPVLVLGKPEGFEHTGTYVVAPSVKATLGTAGGVTKLTHCLRRIIRPEADIPCMWEAVGMLNPDTGQPLTDTLPDRRWTGCLVAVDIEVSGDIEVDEPEDTYMLSISFARMSPDGSHIEAMAFGMNAIKNHPDLICHLLRKNKLIAHNGKFDFRWLNRQLIDVVKKKLYPDEDTMIMHHGMWPGAAEHGLKELAHRIFGAPDWEADIKKYTGGRKGRFERIPQHILVKYNAMDVYWTLRLWYRLREMQDEEAKALYYNHAMPASHMLQDVEQFGMAVDLDYTRQIDELLSGEQAVLLDRLQELAQLWTGKDKFNPGSPKQVQALFRAMGVSLSSTAEAVITALAMRTDNEDIKQLVIDLLEYRGVSKALGTYVRGISKKVRNGRVHTSFLVHGTSTGRLSSRKPNLQNITNEIEGRPSIRRMFTVAEGNALVGVDYAQAELRTMAELSGDEKMISHLQRDSPDFFDNMMPHVFPDVDFSTMDKEHRKPYRLKLKRVVYGTSYGLTPNSVAFMLTLAGAPTTVSEAVAIQDGYLNFYPALQEWRLGVLPKVEAGDDLLTPFGRRFQQDVITEFNRLRVQNQAWAFQPQSIASDICVTAAMDIHRCFTEFDADRGWHLICIVHDAIYAEGPEAHAKWAMAQIQGYMEIAAKRVFTRVPFLTDGHIGKYWNEV